MICDVSANGSALCHGNRGSEGFTRRLCKLASVRQVVPVTTAIFRHRKKDLAMRASLRCRCGCYGHHQVELVSLVYVYCRETRSTKECRQLRMHFRFER